MNILIAIPSPDWINPTFAFDILPSIITYTKNNLKGLNDLHLVYQQGVRTDRNRNIILSQAIKKGDIDYILWLDADMLFPHNIITEYLKHKFDIMGCLYFKKSPPYEPVGYVKGEQKGKYKPLDPRKIKKDTIYKVAGLGFGGMMVKMSVYDKLGDDKWVKYSDDFHMPGDIGQKTHDLVFCEKAKKHGFSLLLHGGVRPAHIGEHPATEKDFLRVHNERIKTPSKPNVLVILPATNQKQADKTAAILGKRAGEPCDIDVVVDKDKKGFVKIVNEKVSQNPDYKYYVYVAQDAFPGKNWLKIGIETLEKENKGVLAFNDGKWQGELASFGLVSRKFIDKYFSPTGFFYDGYHSHYADTELSIRAEKAGELAYNPDAVLLEIDYNKHKANEKDRELFIKRNPNSLFK